MDKNKKILILGISGMLGNMLFKFLSNKKNITVFGTLRQPNFKKFFLQKTHTNIITNQNFLTTDIDELINLIKPEVIINCIGIIKQSPVAKDPLQTIPINALLPHRLAKISEKTCTRIIQISTDCVFSGKKGFYDESDYCDVNDLYGMSKYLGELHDYSNAITLRTSIIGHELNTRYALLDWFLDQNKTITGYKNAIFSGLTTLELAKVIYKHILFEEKLSGLFHIASEAISKYCLLKLIAKIYEKDILIKEDDQIKIDRSLNAEKFYLETGYIAPSWPELIFEMKNNR